MKKIYNALITLGCLGLLASCSSAIAVNNEVKLDEVDVKTSLADNVSDGNTGASSFVVTDIALADGLSTFDNTLTSKTGIIVTFNMDVDSSTLGGITVKSVKDSIGTETGIYEETDNLTLEKTAIKNQVLIYTNLKDQLGVEVYVDSTTVAAKNGQKLDMDGDSKQGEGVEDDYNKYIDSSSSTLASGNRRVLPWRNTLIPSYGFLDFYGSKKIDCFCVNFGEPSSSISSDGDLTTAINSLVEIQKFDTTNKTWSKVDTSCTRYSVTVLNVTSYLQEYMFKLENLEAGTILRAVLNNPKSFTTNNKYNGYKRYLTTDDTVTTKIVDSVTVTNDDFSVYASNQTFFTSITPVTSNNKLTGFEFVLNTSNDSYSDDSDFSGTGTVIGIEGFESNLLFYDKNMEAYDWGTYTVVKSNASTYGTSTTTYYTTYTIVLDKPKSIVSGKYYIYAKPDMEIKFYSSTDDTTKSYKMGISRSSTDQENLKTNCYKQLKNFTL